MGIKSLTQTIKRYAPESIHHDNLYKLSGKKVAVDASLIIYQQLLNNKKKFFKNKDGKITNHITGLFYKIMNYISLNIELIFIFDGKPPDNKQLCIQDRKNKAEKAKKMIEEKDTTDEEKHKLEKQSIRLTKEMIDDVKKLLNLFGIKYIHPEIGEGEAYASELCRMGVVDYVLTEDMDTIAYGCPKVIRNCIDKELKRKDIITIIDYEVLISKLNIDHNKLIDFCILCGCDYCDPPPKVGNITALKLINKYNTIEEIIDGTKYDFPSNYLNLFKEAKQNFLLFYNNIKEEDIIYHTSERDIDKLKSFLIEDVGMSQTRVTNSFKKFHNNYK
jgi:flap endonuclease-1